MKKACTGLLLMVGLLAGHISYGQNAAVKTALSKLDDDQKLVFQKVTASVGTARINTVYYGSFLLQTISTVRNSVNALPSGKKVVLSATQQSALYQINTLADKFAKRTTPYNDSTEADLKTLLSKLDGNIPTPTLINALLIKAGNQGPFEVKVNGDFSPATIDTANIQVDKVKASSIAKAFIQFKFSTEQTGMGSSKELFEWHRYTLRIPYSNATGKKKSKGTKVAEFEFLGCTFPAKPGKVEITTSKSNGNGEVQHKRTRTFLLNSTRENLVEKQCLPKADNGWTILPETAQLEIESSKGTQKRDWNYQKTTSGGNTCFVVETFYNKGGESGKLEFYLKYDVKRNPSATDNEVSTESYDLDWGATQEIPISGTKPELVFTDYKGEKTTMDKDTIKPDGPIVKINEHKITVSMPGIEQLVKPSNINTP